MLFGCCFRVVCSRPDLHTARVILSQELHPEIATVKPTYGNHAEEANPLEHLGVLQWSTGST